MIHSPSFECTRLGLFWHTLRQPGIRLRQGNHLDDNRNTSQFAMGKIVYQAPVFDVSWYLEHSAIKNAA
jgi:hypothetical protein